MNISSSEWEVAWPDAFFLKKVFGGVWAAHPSRRKISVVEEPADAGLDFHVEMVGVSGVVIGGEDVGKNA
jgi:hypothetical protein